MKIDSMEKAQMQRIKTYIYVECATFFLTIFILTSVFILYIPMAGILDFPYSPSKIAIATFFGSLLFSILAMKNRFAKLIIIINILLMLFMIIFGP